MNGFIDHIKINISIQFRSTSKVVFDAIIISIASNQITFFCQLLDSSLPPGVADFIHVPTQ